MGNIWFLSCSTLHYVYQLVANFFCMPFGDEQVQCTVGFSLAILLKTAVSVYILYKNGVPKGSVTDIFRLGRIMNTF